MIDLPADTGNDASRRFPPAAADSRDQDENTGKALHEQIMRDGALQEIENQDIKNGGERGIRTPGRV